MAKRAAQNEPVVRFANLTLASKKGWQGAANAAARTRTEPLTDHNVGR